ncbi:MAG: IS1595 family transposase [Roseicyclus sp.]|nr:IS1595 family transposase [Roseicyclus sp.]MBO6624507.1 IS1595 family transposase [Roseicyclus sp.]MBO6921206.1 IS1595 family transposase [Roseicyclus sp.]
MSALSRPEFHNEEAAYAYVEARVWPNGATCPKCGERKRVSKMGGKSTRIGAYKCYRCRKPFTVKVGTVFESSHVKMHLWLQAIYLICGSKKGISSNQLHRILGVTLKTAWFMSHRIREAMRSGSMSPFGSGGGVVEVDETFIGNEPHRPRGIAGYGHKNKVLALVDRSTGRSKSVVVKDLRKDTLIPIILRNVSREAHIMTDEARQYQALHEDFAGHDSVDHSKSEYVRGEIHTNTIEGYFSIFKRGMRGVYQHCKRKHLHRYLAEFDFRYSNRQANGIDDTLRTDLVLGGIKGKRLTYQTIGF